MSASEPAGIPARNATPAQQQASLRRLSALVAGGAAPADVFAAIAREVAEVLRPRLVQVLRFERDGSATVVGTWGEPPNPFPVGSNWPWLEPGMAALDERARTGLPVRVGDLGELEGTMAHAGRQVGIGSAAGAPILVAGEPWGLIGVGVGQGAPLPDRIEERLADFTGLVATAISSSATQEQLARLADEQAALRRVATLVARGAPAKDVFDAVVAELGRLLGASSTGLVRFEDGDTATLVAGWGRLGEVVPVGNRLPLGGTNAISQIARTGRPARVDDYARAATGHIADRAHRLDTRTSAGGPVVVAGRLWGAMIAAALGDETLPRDVEPRLEQFTELVATAIANTEARAELEQLARVQAALRRVATLVAEAATPGDVFDAVIVEVAQLLGAVQVGLMRAESADEITIVAHRGQLAGARAGMRLPLEGDSVTARVVRTRRSARLDRYDATSGPIARLVVSNEVAATVGAPITVEGRFWGVITASWVTGQPPPPADAEERLVEFAGLIETAIANADSRDQLEASRARMLTAGDEARRRVVRDLHDGAQQRLVHTILTLKLAQRALGVESERSKSLVAEALEHAEQGNAELRELAQGILPAALTRGGLQAAVAALVSRLELAVRTDITGARLPRDIEASAYFIVAEALTNVVKHARAASAEIVAVVEEGTLRVSIRDDGTGGADPNGSGLLGLGDRAAALGGRLRVESPRGGGTVVIAELPLSRPRN